MTERKDGSAGCAMIHAAAYIITIAFLLAVLYGLGVMAGPR